MEVVTLLLFVGAVWVVGVIGLFGWNFVTGHHHHVDRLALLPLQDNWIDPGASNGRPSSTPSRQP